jgi:hypothetical protein
MRPVGWLDIFTNLRKMRLLGGCFAFHNCDQVFLARPEVMTAVFYKGKVFWEDVFGRILLNLEDAKTRETVVYC